MFMARGTTSFTTGEKGISKTYHKALRCISGSHTNLTACSSVHLCTVSCLAHLCMLQSQIYRSPLFDLCIHYFPEKNGNPPERLTSHWLQPSRFQVQPLTVMEGRKKKIKKNLILAYLQKSQIKAQETLLEYLCWVTVFCFPFNTSDVIKSYPVKWFPTIKFKPNMSNYMTQKFNMLIWVRYSLSSVFIKWRLICCFY